LGEIYHGKAKWLRRTGCPKFGTWFGEKKLAGGGALLDIGVHMLDLCLFLMDSWKPECVTGQVYTKFGNRGLGEGGWGKSDKKKKFKFDVDDFASGFIKFKGGATIELNVSWAIHQENPNSMGVDIFGTEGGASAYPNAKIYRYGKKQGEYEVVEPQNVKISMPHANRHVNWIDAILKQDKPLCTLDQALTIQKILDGIYKSSQTGRESVIK
ncbi:MAG: Gfo/Idh/MocA family oxidoreductase, partial [Planctomycetes bacterium]|nr:Gfo/Idh/MocA family oxidoreductase [Planctomycetota bacterium]